MNSIHLLSAFALRFLLGSAVFFYLAYAMQEEEFALLSLAFVIGSIVHVAQDMGLYFKVAEARAADDQAEIVQSLSARCQSSLWVGLLALPVFLYFFAYLGIVLVLLFCLYSFGLFFAYLLRADERHDQERNGLVLALVAFGLLLLLLPSLSLINVVSAFVLARLIQLLYYSWLLRENWIALLSAGFFSTRLKKILSYGVEYSFPLLLGALFLAWDSMLVSVYYGESLATYQVAYRIVMLSVVASELLMVYYYPKCLAGTGFKAFGHYLAASTLVAAMVYLFFNTVFLDIFRLVYGEGFSGMEAYIDYMATVSALKILAGFFSSALAAQGRPAYRSLSILLSLAAMLLFCSFEGIPQVLRAVEFSNYALVGTQVLLVLYFYRQGLKLSTR